MPQSSLLSYFSKSVTANIPTPVTARNNGLVPSGHGTSPGPPSSRQPTDDGAPKEPPRIMTQLELNEELASQRASSNDLGDRTNISHTPAKPPVEHTSNSPDCVPVQTLPGAVISPVQEEHVPAIRRLTSTTLPVRYSESFFTAAVTDPVAHRLSRVALYPSEPVGWISCRLEPCSPNHAPGSKSTAAPSQVYIQALAVLSPYRNLGLATALWNEILHAAVSLEEQPVCIYAHVWEKNEDALDWYAKRGFKRVVLLERYYIKLRPSGAWIVRRELTDI